MIRQNKWIAVITTALLAASAFGDNLTIAPEQLVRKGHAKVTASGDQILLQFDNAKDDSGLHVMPPKGSEFWDLASWRYLAVDVENLSTDVQQRLLMQVSSGGPDKKSRHEINIGIGLNPGEKRTLRLQLPHRWKFETPSGEPGTRWLDTAKIHKIEFFVQWPYEITTKDLMNCRLSNLRVEEKLTPTAPMTEAQYVPFIDEYGQYIHGDWKEKIKSPSDLRANYAKEKVELDAAKPPEEWNKFGGWKNGPQLKATGNFRTEKYQGKWYLVDPEGRLFFSYGVDVLSKYNDPLKVVPGKESWFKSLPAGAKIYLPTEIALCQKYGTENYQPEYFQNLSKRLTAWGFNSIGDWSQTPLIEQGKQPYTLQLTDYDWKMPRLGESKLKFYDVYDKKYIDKMKNLVKIAAERDAIVTKSLTDPMCIGYWIDNELDFGNRGKLTLVNEILKCKPTQAAKQELIRDMKEKYGSIEKLNAAWKTSHKDWDALLASTSIPESEAFNADSAVFAQKMINEYFRLARDAVKSVAPNRLYLGARFIGTDSVRPMLYKACEKYSDVLSVNIYAHSIANFPIEGMPDMPVIIGEFHFGVLDRGMFNPAVCAGITQEDRALAFTRFMQGALVHPNIVGAHWFQYRDQPLTGRGDGEAYQIGFVDVTDTPYTEICRAARDVGESMYRYRLNGKLVNDMKAAK